MVDHVVVGPLRDGAQRIGWNKSECTDDQDNGYEKAAKRGRSRSQRFRASLVAWLERERPRDGQRRNDDDKPGHEHDEPGRDVTE